MQDFNLCKAVVIGLYDGSWLKTKLLKHRLAVRVMKLTAFLLLVCLLDVSAKAPAQEKITIKAKGATLINIFTQINKQTGYNFLFTNEDIKLAKPVDIDVKNASLKDVLDICFKKQDLIYNISNKIITIQAKKNDSPPLKASSISTDAVNIHGKVVDENGKPVPGVTVTVKGTKKQTITDENGEFTIPGVETNAILAFSTVNMEPFEIRVDGKTEIFAKLKTKTSELDEVQIIAYGQTTKRVQTGNVSTIKGEDIQKQPVNNPLLALEGRVPGMFITQNNGIPGGGVTVRIQGQNSIQSGNDPLYVIDGVPINSQLPGTGVDLVLGNSGTVASGSLPASGNPLNYINPTDIESIDVLKDADATAIYGSRAANGAILITTKKGKAGRAKVDLNIESGWGKVTRKLNMLNTRQYLDMRYEALRNDGINWTAPSVSANDLKVWDTTRYTDWQKVFIGNTSHYNNFSGSISGGTTAVQYLVSGTYLHQTTVFPLPTNFADQKGSLHFSLNGVSQNSKFRFQLSGNYMVDNNQLPSQDLTPNAIRTEPVAPELYNTDGSLNWALDASGTATIVNPMTVLYTKYVNKTNNLVSNLILGYKILPGLEITSNFGYTNMETNDFTPQPLISIRPNFRSTSQRSALFGNRNINSWIIEPQLTYRRNFGKGKIDLLCGSTILQNKIKGGFVLGLGYSSDQVLENLQAAAAIQVYRYFLSQYKYNAGFGRLNYNWLDKYIVNLTARRDGSSRFGSSNQFHNFGAIGLAWLFSNESYIKQNLRFISFGKLRASYGTTGNDQLPDYSYLSLYGQLLNTEVPYQGTAGIQPVGLPNPYLQWEATKKLQAGITLGLLDERALLDITYSRNRSSNQLLPYSLASVSGFSGIITNFPATIANDSWELSFTGSIIKTRKFIWTANANLTLPKNKLLSFPNLEQSSYANTLVIGQPISIMKLFHFLGVDPTTGQYIFQDSHGNATSSPRYLVDNTELVSTLPKFYGGLQNSFKYARFQLDFLFQFVKQTGANTYFNNGGTTPPGKFSRGTSNQPSTVLNRWQKPGDNALIQKYSAGQLSVGNALTSDAAYNDASYIRLKNVSLSWSIPDQWLHEVHIQSTRVFMQGQNLLTITNYKGLDPENQTIFSLPPLRMIIIGLYVGL